jgi:predicted aspartyl protease
MKPLKLFTLLLALITLGTAGAQTDTGVESALPGTGTFEFSGPSAILPLTDTSGHPRVRVDLGDGQEYTFIVDTGATVNILDSALAERLGYEVVGETEIGAPGGPAVPANIVSVPVARIGEASISNAGFVTMDINGFSKGLIQGVLSLRLFHDYLLTYDQSNGRISVTRESLDADEPDVILYADLDGQIQVDIDVAGMTVTSHIDTGSMGTFTFPVEYQESLPLKSTPQPGPNARLVGGERSNTLARLDGRIRFAGNEFVDPDLVFMDPSPGYGNIGMGVMSHLQVSIDQQNHLVRFHRPAGAETAADAGERRRLGLMLGGAAGTSGLEIAGVVPGSLAESAGLREGDRLVTVNGRRCDQFTMPELGELFGSPAPLTLGIERDGAAQTIEIR